VVLFVGAKLLGQASVYCGVQNKIGTFARKPVFPVMAITVFPNRFKSGTRTLISGLSFRDTNDTVIILNHS
jgi:hypothetical protein